MKKKELHLVIVWDAAKDVLDKIINKIDTDFIIKDIYNISWDKELFVDNLVSFYSHSQYHLNARQAKKLFFGKANYCGVAPFNLIVFEDDNPTYDNRNTSSGEREVNINVFDLKLQFRELTGGGHKIHGTDSIKETNKDLTLLLGTNIEDFYKNHNREWDRKVKILIRNITGVKGYNSLEEFFYVLNASLEYVVLRNFESFPENYVSDEHGDIDLLVDNLNLIVYLTWAKKVFNNKNRVHYTIKINNEDVPFDFRFIGDNYYDVKWEKEILKSRVLTDDNFYTPNTNNLFYSLLYHALIHKFKFSKDYKQKIKNLNNNVLLDISEGSNLLIDFMQDKGYEVKEPIDVSVLFNTEVINYTKGISFQRKLRIIKGIAAKKVNSTKKEIGVIYYKGKELISSLLWLFSNYAKFKKILKVNHGIKNIEIFNLIDWHNGASYFIGYNKSSKVFIKVYRINNILLNNELKAYNLFLADNKEYFMPKVYHKGVFEDTDFIIQEFLVGFRSLDYILKDEKILSEYSFSKITGIINSFINYCQSKNVVHRDLRPANLMVRISKETVLVKVIDFSFMIDANNSKNRVFSELDINTNKKVLLWLGDIYKPKPCVWDDAFSFSVIIKEVNKNLKINQITNLDINNDENIYSCNFIKYNN